MPSAAPPALVLQWTEPPARLHWQPTLLGGRTTVLLSIAIETVLNDRSVDQLGLSQ